MVAVPRIEKTIFQAAKAETFDETRASRTRRFALVLTVLLFAFLLTEGCLAMPARDLLVRSWPIGSDVRQQSIQAMLATRDGYLWVGTGRGLVRFDGVSFTAFTAENTAGIDGNEISYSHLWEDNNGILWAGTYSHGVICNDHGRFFTLGKEQGLPSSNVLRIDSDDAGAVWVFTSRGVVRWQKGRLEQVHPGDGGALIGHEERRGFDFDTMGLWRRTGAGLERFAFGAWHRFPTPPDESTPLERDVKSIYEDHLHRVWYSIFSQPGRYFCASNGKLTTFSGLPPNAFVSYQDSSGYLWMNDHGAHPARWKAGKTYPLPLLHTSFLLKVIERADGGFWAGSFYSGLFQYRQKLISSIPTAGVPEQGSMLFQQRNGDIWAGGAYLLKLSAHSHAQNDRSPATPVISTSRNWDIISALSEDRQGHLLIGSRSHVSGQVLDHGKLLPYPNRNFVSGPISAMLLTASGDQWIGTKNSLYRYKDHQTGAPELLRSGVAVRCLTETAEHVVWVGTTEGPLQLRNGHELPLPATAPWSYGEVYAIAADPIDEVWIATAEHGIVRFAGGRFTAFDTTDGLPTNTVYSVNFDDDNDLWIRSNIGLLRIRRQSIEPRASDPARKLQVTFLDESDGLPATNMEPPGNRGFLHLDDGTLWFATTGGVASLHPSDFAYKASSPHAILEEHVIDQSNRVPGSTIALSPQQSNLELHYTALGSRRPEQLNFRYRLRGFDRRWIDAGTRRVAYYTQLPPGKYVFEVQAAENDDDLWNSASALAQIEVLTPFYRTWWMTTLLCCVAFGTLVFFMHTRRRHALERTRIRQLFTHKLIATQEGERRRIAHELHDSIGQHLVLIRNLALLPKMSAGVPGGNHFSKIAEQAEVAIKEVETISYDLRPYQLDRLGLTKTLTSLVESFESSSPVRVTQSIQNVDGFFPKEMEINIYRIVQEALGNILKHAEATEVSITVTLSGMALQLVIADNGRGFVPSATGYTLGGLGLVGIEERAEALGGRSLIESGDRVGTRVTVTVTRTE